MRHIGKLQFAWGVAPLLMLGGVQGDELDANAKQVSDGVFARHLQGCWNEVIDPPQNMVSRVWCFSGSTYGTVVGVFSAPTEGWDETYDYRVQNSKLTVDWLGECDALVVPKTKLTLSNCKKGDGSEGATYTFAEPQ